MTDAPSRTSVSRTGTIAILALVALLAAACAAPSASPSGGTVRVVATTTVFADLVAQVGGDAVTVTSIVPAGGEAHTFDPTPSGLRAVADADLVVMNGLGLDDWLATMVADSGSSAALVVLGEDLPGVTYLDGGEHAEDETDPGVVNPHLWLDVENAVRYVERITDALADVDPSHAETYASRGADYGDRLGTLDAWAAERLAAIPAADRLIVSFHEAFPYFAAAYGLTVVGTIVDAPGQDPSAGEIASLVAAIRESGAKAVFGEAQFDPALVRTVAEEAGVEFVTDLYSDSLGDAPVDTYEGMIRWDVDRVVDALDG